MAPKAKGQKNANSWEYSFLNIRLSSQDEKNLAAMDCATEYPIQRVFDLAHQGYKLSVNFDAKNQSFVASLADNDEHSPFYKHILTGRGATASDAWYALAYRHFDLAQGDWANIASASTGEQRRFW